jgi:hypothetical protein
LPLRVISMLNAASSVCVLRRAGVSVLPLLDVPGVDYVTFEIAGEPHTVAPTLEASANSR